MRARRALRARIDELSLILDCGVLSRARASCVSAGRPSWRRLARQPIGMHAGGIPRTSILRVAGRRVRARGEPPRGGKSLLGACNAISLSSADIPFCRTWNHWQRKASSNLREQSAPSRNSHAKLQTTPRPSEINTHAAGTTSPTCFDYDAKSISRRPDTTARNRCQPSPHAKRT